MPVYFPPSLEFTPKRLVFSTWMDHLPFGYDIVVAQRPRITVELGSYNGLSFFAFCQAMQEHRIDGLAYAVDCWAGDFQTGEYDESVFQSVKQHAREHYRGFAYLLKMYFEQALGQFEDESIDLLHIDGLHTYDAVRGDFDAWYPKVAPGGVVLLHDVVARLEEFGVYRFWNELAARSDLQTFRFDHGFGLGVLRKPGGPERTSPLLDILFSGSEEDQRNLRRFYVYASQLFEARRKLGGTTRNQKILLGGSGKPGGRPVQD